MSFWAVVTISLVARVLPARTYAVMMMMMIPNAVATRLAAAIQTSFLSA